MAAVCSSGAHIAHISGSALLDLPAGVVQVREKSLRIRFAEPSLCHWSASPTAGSASTARIFLSGKDSDNTLINAAERDVFPTPPFPAKAKIFVCIKITFVFITNV